MRPSVSIAPSERRCWYGIIAFWSTLGQGGHCPVATGSIPPIPGWPIGQATFNIEGARRAGAAGDGLMLSRTQPRPAGKSRLSLPDIQNPMIDAYLASL